MNRCWPVKPPPCPSGTIDIQDNGQNDGGDDCQPLRQMPSVTAPVARASLGTDGAAACNTSRAGSMDVGGMRGRASHSYPRMMVANDMKLVDLGILPSVDGFQR
jgi:hypothetical protein